MLFAGPCKHGAHVNASIETHANASIEILLKSKIFANKDPSKNLSYKEEDAAAECPRGVELYVEPLVNIRYSTT